MGVSERELELRAPPVLELPAHGFLDELTAIPLPAIDLMNQVGGERHCDPFCWHEDSWNLLPGNHTLSSYR